MHPEQLITHEECLADEQQAPHRHADAVEVDVAVNGYVLQAVVGGPERPQRQDEEHREEEGAVTVEKGSEAMGVWVFGHPGEGIGKLGYLIS